MSSAQLEAFIRSFDTRVQAPVPTTIVAPIIANAGTAVCPVDGFGTISLAMVATTLSGHNASFEHSLDSTNGTDGTWYSHAVVRSNANTIETATGVLAATPTYTWDFSCVGYAWVRMRATAHTGGTASYVFRRSPAGIEPLPAAQISGTQPVSGTVTANIGTGSVAAGTNAIGDVGVQYRANATGAGALVNVNCPATPAAQQIKSGAGRLVGLFLYNTSASVRWVKLFNLAGASVTPGTTAAVTEIGIAAGRELVYALDGGTGFSTGITIMITGAAGLTNNTGVTLADVTGFAVYA